MSERQKKMERVLKVQKQLHRIAELKFIDLQRKAAELKAEQETLIQTMSEDDVLHGLFVDVMAKRLQALAGQSVRIESAKTIQKDVTFERAMQVKRTEKMVVTLKDENRQIMEKKELSAILEVLITKAGASFP